MANKTIRVAINGFGRIGRLFLKQSLGNPNFQVVAVNDLGDPQNLVYLLKYDTVYGRFGKDVVFDPASGELSVGGEQIEILQTKDPAQLPWKDLDIDIVVESTGLFESFEKAKVHFSAGAKRVIISAPSKEGNSPEGKTILMGINEKDIEQFRLTSNASCTTNAVAPVMQILSENPGILKAVLGTVHAYTATQAIVDGPVKGGKDFRRGRAGAQNISPSTTGAAIAVTLALPELTGKFDGLAFRVPVPTGSLADITFVAKRRTSVEEINSILSEAVKEPRWQGIMKVTNDQVVSSDIIGEPYGAVVDLNFTKVIDGDLVKVLSWYDNEYGYAATLVKHVEYAALHGQ